MSLVENLFLEYGDFRVDIPKWEISDEGITALIGPSGSGKTTIFRALIGLEPCPTLRWTFKGDNIAALPVPERRLGVLFQGYELFPHMTARENILFALKARKLTLKDSNFDQLVKMLSLETCLDKKVGVLSGGEKQRTALVRALIGRPRFALLDEPFSALDEELRGEARKLVRQVIDELKIPSLLITHDKRDIESICDFVCQLPFGQKSI